MSKDECAVKILIVFILCHVGGLLHRYGKFLNLLKDGAENDLALVLKHCERFLKQQQSPVTSSLHILFEWIYAEPNYLPILPIFFRRICLHICNK